jgi:integrase
MGSIRVRKDNNQLFFDFRFKNKRCRELTMLNDTKANRVKMESALKRLEKEIKQGTFDYAAYFPNSSNIKKFNVDVTNNTQVESVSDENPNGHPTFGVFAATWLIESEVAWRDSHKKNQKGIINGYLMDEFKDKVVSQITKAEILAFRAKLAKVPGRKAATLSNKRINSVMAPLRQIIDEAADRYEFSTPYRKIKLLKVPKVDIHPFSLAEVELIITKVRDDFKNYYTVRFFTAMRPGEIDGLKWKYVDFENRQILVRETIVDGKEEYTKTDGSQREIDMSEPVYDALKAQYKVSHGLSEYVFCTSVGKPLDKDNVRNRVWYPLLRHLNLRKRVPYQTRHTGATLWLASGENPEWIARQMGHVSTEMLFTTYSRFVPNLTRKDGSAFENLLSVKTNLIKNSAKADTDKKEVN